MIFIKGLIFLIANMLIAYLLVFSAKAILFYPKRKKYWGSKQIPFTPGLMYRKQKWLINKLHSLLEDYLKDCKIYSDDSRISKWESNVYDKAWQKFDFFEKPRFIPASIKKIMHYYSSLFVMEFVRQFLRNFVPYLMDRYNINKYVDLVDKKLNVDMILDFFNKKIYKYLLMFFVGIALLIGIFNMIIFFIVN